jgi:HEAT repeat protein
MLVQRSNRTVLDTAIQVLVCSVVLTIGPLIPNCAAQGPPTIEAELSRYGIPLTESGLRAALRDPRPQVRSLAAGELSERKDVQSLVAIEQALKAEKQLLVRFNMASALVTLKSDLGKNTLLQICEDSSVPEGLRLQAASRLLDVDDDRCVPQVAAMLRTTRDPSSKASALLALSRAGTLPESQIGSIHPELVSNLRDPNPAIRQYAGECIAAIDDQAAAPELKTAIAIESDPTTKDRMENSLKALECKRE